MTEIIGATQSIMRTLLSIAINFTKVYLSHSAVIEKTIPL
ncbi:MAG: hypothetical protein OFPII_30680 [Osedax symbiont Rs1]|nr:MAG: hypothetical protein OFPII_30680 [Osedax symbiont Rs1]